MRTRSREQLSVVLVDDNLEDRALARGWLERDGQFTVVGEAGNATQALEVCASAKPSLVLMDINMPGRDGLEVLPELRAALPAVTLVVISGFSASSMARRAREAGADGYLEKARPARAQLSMLREIVAATRSRRADGTQGDGLVPRQRGTGQRVTRFPLVVPG